MAPHDTYVINTKLPPRRWSRPYAIVPSDTNSDKNLQRNGLPYRFICNTGTSGVVTITFEPDNATGTAVSLYLAQGEFLEGGHWCNARATGLTPGATLVGFVGMESVGS
jgi:hypothetical protein